MRHSRAEAQMAENEGGKTEQRFTIWLVRIKRGADREKLIDGLNRIFKKKTREEIEQVLNRLPLALARVTQKEKAQKVKAFLESVGGILEITATQPVHPSKVEGPEEDIKESPEAEERHVISEEDQPPFREERRSKPRVHAGIQLKPMGIGELLDRSFRLMRQYFWLFFLIALVPQGVSFLVSRVTQLFLGGFGGGPPTMAMGVGFGISGFFALVVFIILQFWAQGALIHAVSETYLGHTTTVMGSYGAMRRLLGRLLGTMILFVILVALVPAFTGIVMAILLPILSKLGVGKVFIGLLVFIVVVIAVWIFFRLFLNWLLIDKVVVLEGKGWVKALKRSTELMKGRTEPGFWKSNKTKAGLILFLGFLIALGIQLIFQIPGLIFGMILKGNLVVQTVLAALDTVGNTLATAFTATAMILYYYDIRLRKEGFDLKMMAENI